jgi:hypothetical protein
LNATASGFDLLAASGFDLLAARRRRKIAVRAAKVRAPG